MTRPVTITIAVVLQWIAAIAAVWVGMELISAAILISSGDAATQLEGAMVQQGVVNVSGTTIAAGVLIAGVLTFVVSFLRVLFSVFLWQGRAWARVAVSALAVLSACVGVALLIEGLWVRGALVVVIDAAVLLLMFAKPSSAFIKVSPQ
jgi:hypothetical protein